MNHLYTGVTLCIILAAGAARAQDAGPGPGTSTCEYPNVVIVIDRSGSMTGSVDVSDKSKYEIARETIESVLGVYKGAIKFGLAMYPWGADMCGRGLILVIPGLDTAQRVIDEMASEEAQPSDGLTPMGDTLNALAGEPLLHDTARRNFVLFITDGMETCEGDPIGAVTSLWATNVGVFVVGFGAGVDATTLTEMAQAGGYPQVGATTSYYKADDSLGLYDALNNILKAATTEICDGLDNDCNGQVDDNVAPKKCAGPCGARGQKPCVGGVYSEECLNESGQPFTDADRAGCDENQQPDGCSCSFIRF